MLKRLVGIWSLVIFIGLLVYASINNVDWIYVFVPFVGQVRTLTSVALIVAFAGGAIFTSLFFSTEIVRRRMEVRSKNKKIKELEKQLQQTVREPRFEPGYRDS